MSISGRLPNDNGNADSDGSENVNAVIDDDVMTDVYNPNNVPAYIELWFAQDRKTEHKFRRFDTQVSESELKQIDFIKQQFKVARANVLRVALRCLIRDLGMENTP